MEVVDWIGTLGVGFILLGFLLRRSKQYGVGTLPYQLINLFGAAILIWYAWATETWPFLLLNVVWLADALRALTKKVYT